MGVLIVAGTVTLVTLIVQRAGGGNQPAAIAGLHLGQPAGTRMLSVAGADGVLAVLVARPDGERLVLLDARAGRVLGEVRASE